MVTPNRYPEEIMQDVLTYGERESLTEYLTTYQRTKPEWDNFKSKLPDILLSKLKTILSDCRKNGFVNPHIQQGKIVWRQIMGNERSRGESDECTLCVNNMQSGTCKGYFISKPENGRLQRMFKKCWELV
jgi:hypothetical protein